MTKLLALAAPLALAALAGCAHDTPAPSSFEVVAITPADGSASVSGSQAVQVQFNKDVHPEAVASGKNILVVDSKNRLLRGTFTVSTTTVTFAPSGGFAADETFGVAVLRTTFDLNGVPLRYPRAALFSTGAAVEPIDGFPPFEEYPLAPDASKIVAEVRGAETRVTGSAGAVEAPGDAGPVNVNARNLTAGGSWVVASASSSGSFQAVLPGGAKGDLIEISASFPETGKTGPSVTVVATFPFTWAALAAAGTAPSARQGHTAVLDAAAGRMILFGGSTNALGVGGASNQLFSLSLLEGSEAWVALSLPSPPSARSGHTAVVDAAGGRMIVFGGDTGSLAVRNDAWALSLAPGAEAWTPLNPSGTPPAARAWHAAVWDAANRRMIVFAGRGAQGLNPPTYSDMFALNLPASGTPSWTVLAPSGTGPTARSGLFAVLDGAGTTALLGFGLMSGVALPDTYALALSGPSWTPVLSAPSTTGRAYAAAALDTALGRALVFGGGNGTTSSFDDLFAYSFAAGSWSALSPEGSGPSSRSGASLVFDPVAGRAVLFGGADLASAAVFDDLFELR